MIDGIKVFCRSHEAHDRLLLEKKQELVFSGEVGTGAITKHSCKNKGMYVDVFETSKDSLQPGISIRGSLHRYWKGSNCGLFKFTELADAVQNLCREYHINPKECEVHAFEFGVNIDSKCPAVVINAAMLFHGRTGKRDPGKRFFGKRWEFDQYDVKLYKKSHNQIRYELRIKEMSKIHTHGIHIYHLSDLCNYCNFVRLLRFLYTVVDEFLFVPSDKENRLPHTETTKWNDYRADSFWDELSKDQKYRATIKVKHLTSKYGLIKWNSYIKDRIIVEGCRMLETSPENINAMFSELGLLTETVAGPKGIRDRQTENTLTFLPQRRRVCRRETGVSSYHPQFILHPARPPPRAPSAN